MVVRNEHIYASLLTQQELLFLTDSSATSAIDPKWL